MSDTDWIVARIDAIMDSWQDNLFNDNHALKMINILRERDEWIDAAINGRKDFIDEQE